MPPNDVLPIVYQDDDVVVVNKPAGVAAHEATSFKGDDVYHLLIDQGVDISTSGDEYRQGIVSRLDVGTSGLMVVAKNESAYTSLKEQFSAHSVKKVYIALAEKRFRVKYGTIDAPIGRHTSKRALFAVVEGGKPAITHFDVLEEYTTHKSSTEVYTLLKITLETGRTHQIRVHLSAYGHPLVGDAMYGHSSPYLPRPFLHSAELTFEHPVTQNIMHFEAPLSDDLDDMLAEFVQILEN